MSASQLPALRASRDYDVLFINHANMSPEVPRGSIVFIDPPGNPKKSWNEHQWVLYRKLPWIGRMLVDVMVLTPSLSASTLAPAIRNR